MITKIDWQPMLHVWYNVSDNRFNELLSCSIYFFQYNKYLETFGYEGNIKMTEKCMIKMQKKECFNRFLDVVARHARNNTTLEYIITNFEKIKPK